MSHTHPTSTSSSFQLILNDALNAYKRHTKKDLLKHPLADRLQACDTPSSILTVLQEQVQELNGSQRNNTDWLDPIVHVIHTFSVTLGEGVGAKVFPPAKVIFTGLAVLLSTANAVRADQDILFEIFGRIEAFFLRLELYTKVTSNQGMLEIITAIIVEVLNFIGIATKEIKQGRTKKYLKKLIGRTDIEDALKRLDRLTQEEARMAAAQILNVTDTIDNRVQGIADSVLGINNRMAGIDERVAGVDERVACADEHVVGIDDRVAGVDVRLAGVDDRVKDVDDKVKAVDDKLVAVIDDGNEARVVIQQTADGVDRMERNQLRQELRRWLSPPDPSTNHIIACNAHLKGTSTWFFGGRAYKEWKTTGSESLLWIHGKPGSGKSIICSAIIQDIEAMCDAGQASMGYFYFDFRDIKKQHWHDLVTSVLTQLSAQSGPRCDILSRLHSDHDSGMRQPNDDILTWCLEKMLTLPDQRPIYLIFDALDECSNVSGIQTSRKRVLQLVKKLLDLHIPNLHICVTSRPEVDIRYVLEPLTSRRVSLHDQSGQKKDIEDYVRSVIYSDSEPIMQTWRQGDKQLVIKTLSERADGMFRWILCQLEVLRDCIPSSVGRTLEELPESLDETYERILKGIKKPNRTHARRILQCLFVAIRPLRVAELAEVLAVDFDDAEGIPRLNPDWRSDEQEIALLSACSSLIAIVRAGGSRVVQFSHFSVKEFLTSPRLANASGEVSNYHIDSGPAHTIMAQACLGVLLQLQNVVEGCTPEDHPLTQYAAEEWTAHVQFGEVLPCLRKGMEYLFDANKPHFNVWLTLCDIDTYPNGDATFYFFAPFDKSPATPLYYAALCGFHDLVEHLMTKRPQDVNADGGYYVRPLVAALAGGHFRTADLLRRNGANLDAWGRSGNNPLHAAAYSGNFEVIQILIDYDPTYINVGNEIGSTPLHWASESHNFKDGSVLRFLLEHGAYINVQNQSGWTPLHLASFYGSLEVVRLLLEHGGIEVENNDGKTASQVAAEEGGDEVVELLREHAGK